VGRQNVAGSSLCDERPIVTNEPLVSIDDEQNDKAEGQGDEVKSEP
jgi:hypothetical protein